jgi:hypothetical protein
MASTRNNEYNNDPVLKKQNSRLLLLEELNREIEDCKRIMENAVDSYPPGTPVEEYDGSSDHPGMYLFYLNRKTSASENKQIITLGLIKELNREIEYCEIEMVDIIESEAAGESVEEYSEENRDAYEDAIGRRSSYFKREQQLKLTLHS